jgi:mannosyltransferase OCH1-like enzyme
MIPRTIHYCWFGNNQYSKLIEKCLETWRIHLQGYELKLWNEQNSPMDMLFVRQAYDAKKYAFVADYVRFWAIYNHGGIYLDTDMYIIKNLDVFLENEVFFGFENNIEDRINGALFGSEKGNLLIKDIIQKYFETEFKRSQMQKLMIPYFITSAYTAYESKDKVRIYPYDFFYPLPFRKRNDYKKLESYLTENTHAVHLWDKSWFSLYDKVKQKLKKKFSRLRSVYSS